MCCSITLSGACLHVLHIGIQLLNVHLDPMTSRYVQAKIRRFEKRFNELKKATRLSLEKRKISVKQVADALTSLSADDFDEHKQFLESHLSVLY